MAVTIGLCNFLLPLPGTCIAWRSVPAQLDSCTYPGPYEQTTRFADLGSMHRPHRPGPPDSGVASCHYENPGVLSG